MAVWKYAIEMKFIHGDDNPIPIRAENIRRLFIDEDYVKNNMPVMYTIINVDKNFFDKIVLYAKEANILLSVYKYDDASEAKINISVYNALCEYFIRDDINYNKEIDYKGTENETRQDIYREGYLGLMFKTCIDANKQTVNNTIKNSTMMNAVCYYVTKTPCLIEPFTYNDTIEQLIVPPQESLVKTVQFFNNVQVFYDTQYRLFFDADCLYLVSSSGKATQKATDKYPTVRITIHSVDDSDGFKLGMGESPNNNCYIVDVSVKDSIYNIDNDTAKMYKGIEVITNPSIENAPSTQGALQNVMNDVSSIMGDVKGVMNQGQNLVKSIPSAMNNMKQVFTQAVTESATQALSSQSCIQKAIQAIQNMPEPQVDPDDPTKTLPSSSKTIDHDKKIDLLEKLTKCSVEIGKNSSTLKKLPGNFSTEMQGMMKSLGSLTSTPSALGALSAINMQDGLKNFTKAINTTKTNSNNSSTNCSAKLMPAVNNANALSAYVNLAIKYIGQSGIENSKVKDYISGLQTATKTFKSTSSSISLNLNTYKGYPDQIKNMTKSFSSFANKLGSMKVNLKSQFSNLKSDLGVLGASMKSKLKSIAENGEKAIQKLRSSGLSLSSLKEIKDNVNAIRDISKIGALGVSKFSVNLNLGKSDTKGVAIYKVNNDNANKVKNIKSEIENSMNKLIINKNDIDVSVFNINMEYIIKNYDAHSSTDGRFILDRKVEMFSRDDGTNFKCTTQLYFRKIADDAGGASMAKANESASQSKTSKSLSSGKVDYAKAAETIVKNASDLFKSIKSDGFNIKSLKKASSNIKNIESAYKSMKSAHVKANMDIMKSTGCFGQGDANKK